MMLPRTEGLLDDILSAGLLPDRSSPWPVEYTVPTSILQDADAHVRLEALLVLSELPPSSRAAATIAEVIAFPANAKDPWTPDAVSMAGTRQGPAFLTELIKRRVPANDSLAVLGMQKAVHKIARAHATKADAGIALGLLTGVAGATEPLAIAMLNGMADGWPQESPPVLSPSQQAALGAAGRELPASLIPSWNKVLVRWGLPEIVR
jgi:hypothetical protein